MRRGSGTGPGSATRIQGWILSSQSNLGRPTVTAKAKLLHANLHGAHRTNSSHPELKMSNGALDSRGLLAAFPPVAYAFTYGSGVFRQASYSQSDRPMIDCVFAVDDPLEWHRANMASNPSHYSFLAAGGPRLVTAVQESFGSRMYYNTHVSLPLGARGAPGQLMKYGVVSSANLLDDLRTWSFLYAAGRMHKPVHTLVARPDISAAATANLTAAASAALLSLPASFTAWDLYLRIAGLSYAGDFRMAFGENPDKVANIVSGSAAHFHMLYSPLLTALLIGGRVGGPNADTLAICESHTGGGPCADASAAVAALRGCVLEQDSSLSARVAAALSVPAHVQRVGGTEGQGDAAALTPTKMESGAVAHIHPPWARAVGRAVDSLRPGPGVDVGPGLYRALVGPTLSRIVAGSARTQSLKGGLMGGSAGDGVCPTSHYVAGLLSAGPSKALAYTVAKLRKYARAVLI